MAKRIVSFAIDPELWEAFSLIVVGRRKSAELSQLIENYVHVQRASDPAVQTIKDEIAELQNKLLQVKDKSKDEEKASLYHEIKANLKIKPNGSFMWTCPVPKQIEITSKAAVLGVDIKAVMEGSA